MLFLNEPLCVLSLSYYSNINTEQFYLHVFVQLGWESTMGRLLGSKIECGIKSLFQGHSKALPYREVN